ncbi:autotransporter assembly complex family protein [Lysobacter sp. CFH 32150]|uniref:autotransporter assembly complex protein TamA n=1 Tax=Lysobacter sp. CFH 32150 TaxID=2927128 RepID=UPI001FA78D54|nr:autotransporter assembly complex family protein [Lysobacter sp. CFH 32150]MCI4567912.1 autotransporter assembly complex protein TamA [Lysobacter sp. CFH 32150]
MRPVPRLLAAAIPLLVAAGTAQAATVTNVEILGLDETMTINVRTALSLTDAIGKDLSGRRLAYLVREAEAETREALEPFGYYSPQITVERSRDEAEDAPVTVTISVQLGAPVRVRRSDIAIDGAGQGDFFLKQEIAAFQPHVGDVFDHAVYEAGKARITRRLAERGYFDADFVERKVEVTRADHAADIALRWDSGMRYGIGTVTFNQAPKRIIRESLLDKLVDWKEGEPYHQSRLDRLRKSLTGLDYFGRIDIEPQPEQAVDGRVPVAIHLTPAKRSIYTAGLSYGTDSGAGVRLGLERRYLNDRGHKLLAQVDWAEFRKTATVQYRIPAFAWLDGWYTASLQGADEQTEFADTRRLEFVASRSGEINDFWTATASLHALRERWRFVSEDPTMPVEDWRYSSLLFPSLRGEYINADDRLYPRDAIGATVLLRGGVEGVGSDATFVQMHGSLRWFRGLGASSRLIARGELGHTFTNALVEMPLSLRFFAGGDRSVRGYEWREIGPRITVGSKTFALGAKNVATGSIEYEQYFNSSWGAAVFVDTGSAFNDTPAWRTGVGIGLRWRSPVGPVRIDVARGLNDATSPFTLHFNIGADL